MTVRILSIDGGGIKGVGPAYLLAELDTALKDKGKPGVGEYFDLYVGTSTGCIIAAGLAAGMPILDIYNLYYTRGAQMFQRVDPIAPMFSVFHGEYDTGKKLAVLNTVLGGKTLGDLHKNFLGTFYSLRPQPGPVFAQGGPQYKLKHKNSYDALLLSEVVNASSNAPLYFDPTSVNGAQYFGVDGGVFANNPSVSAYVEALKMFDAGPSDIKVVSLGCGSTRTAFPGWTTWGVLHWASVADGVPLIEVMLGAQAAVVEHQMEHLLDKGVNYFRLQFPLDDVGPCPIDDTSQENLDRVKGAADAYLHTTDGENAFYGIVNSL